MPIISHATQQVTSSNERSIYNRRPKALFVHTDMLCKHLIEWCLIVDNMCHWMYASSTVVLVRKHITRPSDKGY